MAYQKVIKVTTDEVEELVEKTILKVASQIYDEVIDYVDTYGKGREIGCKFGPHTDDGELKVNIYTYKDEEHIDNHLFYIDVEEIDSMYGEKKVWDVIEDKRVFPLYLISEYDVYGRSMELVINKLNINGFNIDDKWLGFNGFRVRI